MLTLEYWCSRVVGGGVLDSSVVYFNQRLGAAHSKRWWKSPFLTFLRINFEVNGKYEITTQKRKRIFFIPHRDLNHCPLVPKASVLPMSYADPYEFMND